MAEAEAGSKADIVVYEIQTEVGKRLWEVVRSKHWNRLADNE